jgi:hypothetical protein
LRETLQQYIALVKSLTGQERSRKMSDEILNCITKDEESFSAYLSVNKINEEAVFRHILKNKVFPQLRDIAAKYDLEFAESDEGLLLEDYGFKFFIDFEKEWKKLCIFFAFGEKLSDLRFGVWDDSRTKLRNSCRRLRRN